MSENMKSLSYIMSYVMMVMALVGEFSPHTRASQKYDFPNWKPTHNLSEPPLFKGEPVALSEKT